MKVSAAWSVIAVALVLAGCQPDVKTILSLEGGKITSSQEMITITEKGTYYLYAKTPKDKEELRFRKDLKKGDQLGFRRKGNEIQGFAAGTIIELSEAQEGTSYYWKMEEKKD